MAQHPLYEMAAAAVKVASDHAEECECKECDFLFNVYADALTYAREAETLETCHCDACEGIA